MARATRSRWRGIWGCARLVHPFPVATVIATSVLLLLVAYGGWPDWTVLLRVVAAVALSQFAVGALNDYLDRDLDMRVQPDKPIPRGDATPRTALVLTGLSLTLLAMVAPTLGVTSLGLVLLGTGAGLAYDLWLKPTPWSFVAYVIGFLCLLTWTWMLAGRATSALFLLYLPGALLIVAAHLAQSLPDIETDRSVGSVGLAVKLGVRRSLILAVGPVLAAACLGIAVAVITSMPAAALPFALAATASLYAAVRIPAAAHDRSVRVHIFHALAPSIALTGLGGLLILGHVA